MTSIRLLACFIKNSIKMLFKKNYAIMGLCLLLFSTSYSQKEPTVSALQIRNFQEKLDAEIPKILKENKVPGLAIAILDKNREMIKKGYGWADVAKKEPVNSKTGFNIGSVSKLFTAWAIMDLVNKHKINLDYPVEEYLTRWKLPKSEFDNTKVTIRHILGHTAGLSVHGYGGYQPKKELPTLEASLNGKFRSDEKVFIEHEPQTKWQYSGGGYTILQLVIEEVTGESFDDYMEDALFDELGMDQTSFEISSKILKKSSKAYDEQGQEIKLERFTAQAAAGLHTNLDDMIIFAKNNLNGSPILTAANKKEMQTPTELSKGRYGLGYAHFPVGPGKFVTGHAGSNDGWEAAMMLDLSDDTAIVMLSNGSNGKKVLITILKKWMQWKMSLQTGP